MDVMGWSNAAMIKRYAHVTARLLRHIADRLNAFLWTSYETKNETDTAARHDGIDRGAASSHSQNRKVLGSSAVNGSQRN
jgi:hypothetical protein